MKKIVTIGLLIVAFMCAINVVYVQAATTTKAAAKTAAKTAAKQKKAAAKAAKKAAKEQALTNKRQAQQAARMHQAQFAGKKIQHPVVPVTETGSEAFESFEATFVAPGSFSDVSVAQQQFAQDLQESEEVLSPSAPRSSN